MLILIEYCRLCTSILMEELRKFCLAELRVLRGTQCAKLRVKSTVTAMALACLFNMNCTYSSLSSMRGLE